MRTAMPNPIQSKPRKASRLLFKLSMAFALAGTGGFAAAALPVPPETPESKSKAQEAAAKAAEAAKKASEDLSRYMDKAVENYKQRQVNRPAGG
jgi:hypothetical protein